MEGLPPSGRIDLAAYKELLTRLRAAVQNKDSAAIHEIMALLAVPDPAHEVLLWDLIDNNDPDLVLHAGVLLGRIGTSQTLDRVLRSIREMAPGAELGQNPDGTPTKGRAVLNALLANALRAFLDRKDLRDSTIKGMLEIGTAPSADPRIRQMAFGGLMGTAEAEVFPKLRAAFETTEDQQVRMALIFAMTSSRSTEAAIALTDWYESYPDFRTAIAQALASNLPPAAALSVLRDQAVLDARSGTDSPALEGIVWLGRSSGGADTVRKALETEPDALIRRAMVESLSQCHAAWVSETIASVSSKDPDAEVRGVAYALLPQVVDSALAFELLDSGFTKEKSAGARQGVTAGLVNLLGTGKRTTETLALLERELQMRGAGTQGANLVRSIAAAAKKAGCEDLAREMLRRVAPGTTDPLVLAALRQETGQ